MKTKILKSLVVTLLFSFILLTSACQIENLGSYNRGHNFYLRNESELVNKIEVDWECGDVIINFVDGSFDEGIEVLTVTHFHQHETISKIENNTLKIYYCSHKIHMGSLGEKWIEINIPKNLTSLKTIEVDNTSGTVEINDSVVDKLNVDMTSGELKIANSVINELDVDATSADIKINDSNINEINIENVSGKINAEGTFTEIDIETVSGNVNITDSVCPRIINLEAVSSNTIIAIPDNEGFEVELDSVSGTLEIDFEVYVGNTWVYKDGTNKFDFDVVSGDITINKKYN